MLLRRRKMLPRAHRMKRGGKTLTLLTTSSRGSTLVRAMTRHYSQPGGIVGRSIVYAVICEDLYGFTVAGSATKHLPGRDEFIGCAASGVLNNIVNNTFFHVERVDGRYPFRNFVQAVILLWEHAVLKDWSTKYGDDVIAFETLVEPPRTGECYQRAGWTLLNEMTRGYTCRRVGGVGTDSWSGRRVWDTKNLRPKHVLMKMTT